MSFGPNISVRIGAELSLELHVVNTGSEAMRIEEALHTYHRVGDAEQVRVAGLDGTAYLDNMDGNHEKGQSGDVVFRAQTDNAYLDTAQAVEVVDPVLGRSIRTTKKNSRTTVVWNPWSDGAKALADLGDDEWRSFACAEASNIMAYAVDLATGEEHTMGAVLSVTATR